MCVRNVLLPSLRTASIVVAQFAVAASLLTMTPMTRGDDDAAAREGMPPKGDGVPEDVETRVGALILRIVADESGDPVAGANLEYATHFFNISRRDQSQTDAKGDATIEYLPGVPFEAVSVTIRAPGFVPYYLYWDDRRRRVDLPLFKEIRLKPATTIGGIVQDESGRPIAGADVRVAMPATEYEGTSLVFFLGEDLTDDEGRWQIDTAPDDLRQVRVRIQHPDHIRLNGKASHDLDAVLIMQQGEEVRGRVTNEAGEPVFGADVVLGNSRALITTSITKSDETGSFVLKNCPRGESTITVQSDGYSPELASVLVSADRRPVKMVLKPGHTIRFRVVDVDGNPVAGAFVGPERWRDSRALSVRGRTDEEGRFVWQSAPPDAVAYQVAKEGYISSRNVELTAAEEEHVITLNPTLTISGHVTDSRTNEPVPTFTVQTGYRTQDEIYWQIDVPHKFENGHYRLSVDDTLGGHIVLRFEAEGFKLFESRDFVREEGKVNYDVQLPPRQ